jgi:hypothetical protein
MNTNTKLWLPCALLWLAGCATFDIQTPKSFLELEDDPVYDYRATTADGVVLSVSEHEIDADLGSTVDFWIEAIEGRLRHSGGYALTERKQVTTSAGLQGTQLRFGRDEANKPYRYWVTVFVAGDSVYVLEAGGADAAFAARAASLEQAVASFQP